jgi:fructosamine-3-kinase
MNGFTSEWLEFWKEHRLGFQLRLAARNGYTGRLQDLGTRLLECCAELFSDYSPQPSLLHGDLWHGNTACSASGEPVIFDAASYYGDRETDLAMTFLFGGFSEAFMAAYNAAWPVNGGYKLRRDFYNVYHLLNHLNLFGRGYLAQAEATMQRVLASISG